MYHAVVNLFIRYLNKEHEVLVKIADFEGEIFIENNALVFTLKGLFDCLNADEEMHYLAFRRVLYSSRLNEDLRVHNGYVEVHCSTGKVDDSFYRLIHITPEQRRNRD